MDLSRMKKVLAGVSSATILFSQVGTAIAAYSDVPAGSWYADAVSAFMDAGYLDSKQTTFRPMALANRAEFVKLLVELNGGVLSTPPAVGSFTDVKPAAWYYSYFEEAGKEGWVRGDNNCYGSLPCNARPSANVNRAEAAALIVRAFSLESTGAAPQFVDNPMGQWYTDAIQTAADHCVLQGDDSTGRVRPSDNMNRAEMVVMLHRVDQNLMFGTDCGKNSSTMSIRDAMATDTRTIEVDFSTNLKQSDAEKASNYTVTAGSSTMTVVSAKLVGDHTVELMVDADLDPAVTYTVMADVMTSTGVAFSDSATFKGFSATPKGDGVLEASVSSKNPMGDTVPRGANGVTMLSIDLTASCDDNVMINDVTLLHEGFGAPGDLDGVYAAVDGARMTRKRTIDSKAQTATIHFTSPLEIMKCKTVTLDLMADFSTTATTSGEHNLVVELPSDLDSNAKQVTGTFPLKGKTFKVGAVTSGILTVDARNVSPSNVKVSDKEVLIGKFEFAANSVEDQTLYSITLQQDGTAKDGDVANIKVRRTDGTVLTNTVESTVGDYVTLVFDPPFVVRSSDRITLEIVADVMSGANDTVKMTFEETSDIFAVGSLYGYGVNGQLYGSQVSLGATGATSVTIDAGQFTISIDGPSQQTFTRDQDAANLANIKMQSGGSETINVRKLYVAIQGLTATGAGFAFGNTTDDEIREVIENVVLKDMKTNRSYTGVRLTGSSDSSSSTTKTYQIYRFDDFTVKGDQTFQFLVDFIDNGTSAHPRNGDQFKIHICGEPQEVSTGTNTAGCDFGGLITSTTAYQMEVEGLSSTDSVKDVRPRGVITGNAQRIASANLTVAVKSIGTIENAVKNVKNLNLFRFEGRAGEAKDILMTKAIFVASSGSLNNGQNYTLWADTNADGVVDTILQKGVAQVSNKITFDRFTGGGFVIGKEKTVAFEVHSDISASLVNNSGTNWLQIAFDTAGSSNTYIEAQDVIRGSSLSGIKTNGSCAASSGNCDMTVTTVSSKAYNLVNQGDLFVISDTVPVRNQQLLGGDLSNPIFRLQFTSRNEAIDVTDVQLTVSGSTATSVDRLELWLDGATQMFGEATVGGCGSDDTNPGTTFCAKMQNQQLVVPKNADVKVLVRARMKTDNDGGLPAQKIQLFVDPLGVVNYATGSGAIRARGRDSSNNLNRNLGGSTSSGAVFIGRNSAGGSNAIVRGPAHVSVLSKISSITNAHPATNGTAVPTGVADLGMFKIAAAQASNTLNGNNKVTLSGVILNVTANNMIITGNSFVFYNTANSTVTATCTAYKNDANLGTINVASGSLLVDCRNLQSSSVNVTVDPGTDATFALRGTITNNKVVGTNTSTLQVSLQSFDSIANLAYGLSASHFQWQDKDTSATTTATFNWVEYPSTTVNSTSFQS